MIFVHFILMFTKCLCCRFLWFYSCVDVRKCLINVRYLLNLAICRFRLLTLIIIKTAGLIWFMIQIGNQWKRQFWIHPVQYSETWVKTIDTKLFIGFSNRSTVLENVQKKISSVKYDRWTMHWSVVYLFKNRNRAACLNSTRLNQKLRR